MAEAARGLRARRERRAAERDERAAERRPGGRTEGEDDGRRQVAEGDAAVFPLKSGMSSP